ncbi:MAG: HIT domain-containing protein [Anaerolineales bacterium]|nr:MAG: HIT domain-containing protein [Anaerolineales bacterium]
MKHLWAPWRMTYIQEGIDDSECLFCALLALEDGPENLILHRGQYTFVILNRFPYTNGHTMVVPFVHQASLEGVAQEALLEMIQFTQQSLQVLRQAYQTDGFNIGANIGEAAGAGVKEHVHFHIVPRWNGDTNFMATTAETRVLPEDLEVTYHKLRQLWQAAKA